nr:uncharacterized protein BN887_01356 [Melanopsichium pennsylvanicum 4]
MVLPRKHRPSLNASSQIQQTSPSATSTEPRKPCSASSRSSIFTDSTIHTQMAALGAVAGKHTLINSSGGGIGGIGDIRSYSDSEAAGAHATVGGPSHATLHDNIDGKAGGADSETNLDSEAGGGDGTAARSDLFGLNSTTAARRASRGGGGGGGGGGVGVGSGMGNDNKYRVGMLVEEASLLDRRRDDVLYGLEGNSAIVEGDDESDDDVSVIEENRDTRRRSRGRLVGESSTDTTISDK